MSSQQLERRRFPRVAVSSTCWLAVPSTWPIQVEDLGMGGMAFRSPYRLESGRTARIRATLGRNAFSGHFRVRWGRVQRGPHGSQAQFEMGAEFVALDDGSRESLAAFLKLPLRSESQHANQSR